MFTGSEKVPSAEIATSVPAGLVAAAEGEDDSAWGISIILTVR